MSKRNAGRRGRPRKRRATATSAAAGAGAATEPREPPAPKQSNAAHTRSPRRSAAERSDYRDPGGVGERPQAPWHPWPLSELLILVGAIGAAIGAIDRQGRLLFAGLGAVLLGTLEFTVREHRSGYRSHASLLAAVPTALAHGAVALGLFALGGRGAVLVLVPVVVDVPVFWLLFRFMRARFDDARRERVFALRSR